MEIRGSVAKGLLIALAVVLIPVSAVSAQKITPGSTCKVLNQKVVYQNKSYICTKSGKKLVWNKGVATKKSTATPTAEPIVLPTSFEDLYEKRKGISTALWTKINATLSSNVQLPPRDCPG